MKNKLSHRTIKQLLNSVIAKYRDLSVSRRSIICRSRLIDLLTFDKSRYFSQPRPIIVNYSQSCCTCCNLFTIMLCYTSATHFRTFLIYFTKFLKHHHAKIEKVLMHTTLNLDCDFAVQNFENFMYSRYHVITIFNN